MFIIKTKTKVIMIIGIILIIVGISVSTVVFLTIHNREDPSNDEICKLFNDNKESFNIANNYLLKQIPNNDNVVYYNKDTIEKDKTNMTNEEYKAIKTIFSNPLIEYYSRDVDDKLYYKFYGKFTIKSKYQYGIKSTCCLPDKMVNSNCAHIVDNWYLYFDHPVD